MPTEFHLRLYQPMDAHHLPAIDRKVNEFAWTIKDWQLLNAHFTSWQVIVLAGGRTPKGFCVVEYDADDFVARIHKMGVLPGLGVDATVMLMSVEYAAVEMGLNLLEIIVPETCCRGGTDPYDISSIISGFGFEFDARHEGMFEQYGQIYDGFIFTKEILSE